MDKAKKSTHRRSSVWVIPAMLGAAGVVWIIRRRRPSPAAQVTREARQKPMLVVEPEPDVAPRVEPHVAEPPQVETPPRPKLATWQEVEPTDLTDPVSHTAHRLLEGADGWRLAGASRRGKMHAHHGTYREDAFAIAVVGPWHLAAVSDGAGSSRLSRVGSRLAVETAVARMTEIVQAEPSLPPEELPRSLAEALKAAHAAVVQEAERRQLPIKDFSATFLLLVHRAAKNGHLIGSIQVGDGLIAIKHRDGSIEPLAERDSGTFGGETYFLTSRPAQAWAERGEVRLLQEPPALLVAMSDGVADDFIPYEKHLEGLFRTLDKVLAQTTENQDRDVAQILLELIGYDKRGSFDDRTLVILYPSPT